MAFTLFNRHRKSVQEYIQRFLKENEVSVPQGRELETFIAACKNVCADILDPKQLAIRITSILKICRTPGHARRLDQVTDELINYLNKQVSSLAKDTEKVIDKAKAEEVAQNLSELDQKAMIQGSIRGMQALSLGKG